MIVILAVIQYFYPAVYLENGFCELIYPPTSGSSRVSVTPTIYGSSFSGGFFCSLVIVRLPAFLHYIESAIFTFGSVLIIFSGVKGSYGKSFENILFNARDGTSRKRSEERLPSVYRPHSSKRNSRKFVRTTIETIECSTYTDSVGEPEFW